MFMAHYTICLPKVLCLLVFLRLVLMPTCVDLLINTVMMVITALKSVLAYQMMFVPGLESGTP